MNEHPATPRDLIATLLPGVVAAVEWILCWNHAWEWCELHGWCDDLGGAEFRRLTALAFHHNVPNSQVAMRLFIKEEANTPPHLSKRQGEDHAEES